MAENTFSITYFYLTAGFTTVRRCTTGYEQLVHGCYTAVPLWKSNRQHLDQPRLTPNVDRDLKSALFWCNVRIIKFWFCVTHRILSKDSRPRSDSTAIFNPQSIRGRNVCRLQYQFALQLVMLRNRLFDFDTYRYDVVEISRYRYRYHSTLVRTFSFLYCFDPCRLRLVQYL